MVTSNADSAFNVRFFPQHVMLVTVGENMMPLGYWTVVSKDPFRFLICMQFGNHSLGLLRKYREAALHFMPWTAREQVVRAGYISGQHGHKASRLGFELRPAQTLTHTQIVTEADCYFETVLNQELEGISTEFALCILDVTASGGKVNPDQRDPIFFLSGKNFATVGERWKFQQ